jgi:hypothetical protein
VSVRTGSGPSSRRPCGASSRTRSSPFRAGRTAAALRRWLRGQLACASPLLPRRRFRGPVAARSAGNPGQRIATVRGPARHPAHILRSSD